MLFFRINFVIIIYNKILGLLNIYIFCFLNSLIQCTNICSALKQMLKLNNFHFKISFGSIKDEFL